MIGGSIVRGGGGSFAEIPTRLDSDVADIAASLGLEFVDA
jgi:hypothetical protein